ncbi:DUF2613 family protein [Actinokineospora sp.]
MLATVASVLVGAALAFAVALGIVSVANTSPTPQAPENLVADNLYKR